MKQLWETSFSLKEIDRLSVELLQQLSPHESVLLTGEMGAGKTTIVSALLQTLGYDGVVTSPTYTLMHCYEIAGLSPQVQSLLNWKFTGKTGNADNQNYSEKPSSRAKKARSANGSTRLNVYHFDLYRLTDDAEFYHLGIDQLFSSKQLLFIEWGEKNALCLSKADKLLKIEMLGAEERKLSLKAIDRVEIS